MERAEENSIINNRYKIIRKIGDGGMGKIYLADDLKLSRQVAVKTIRPELTGNSEVRKRIDRECNLHARLGVHPHIVALYDKIEQDGNIFLIMEFVDGETLTSCLSRDKANSGEDNALNVRDVIPITCQVLEALSHIHDHDILHRDIKPSNIILITKRDGTQCAKLMDFGIASQERDDETLTRLTTLDTGGPGTPAYMAPERIDSITFGEAGPPTDLYSVGVILYQLFCGDPPFQGTMTEIFTGHLAKEPDLGRLPGSLPQTILEILKKSLAKRQDQRFQNAREFAEALWRAQGFTSDGNSAVAADTDTSLGHTVLATGRHSKALAEAVVLSRAKQTSSKKWLGLALAIVATASIALGAWTYKSYMADKASHATVSLRQNPVHPVAKDDPGVTPDPCPSPEHEALRDSVSPPQETVQPVVKVAPNRPPPPEKSPIISSIPGTPSMGGGNKSEEPDAEKILNDRRKGINQMSTTPSSPYNKKFSADESFTKFL